MQFATSATCNMVMTASVNTKKNMYIALDELTSPVPHAESVTIRHIRCRVQLVYTRHSWVPYILLFVNKTIDTMDCCILYRCTLLYELFIYMYLRYRCVYFINMLFVQMCLVYKCTLYIDYVDVMYIDVPLQMCHLYIQICSHIYALLYRRTLYIDVSFIQTCPSRKCALYIPFIQMCLLYRCALYIDMSLYRCVL